MNRPVRTRTPGGVGGASEQSGSLSRLLFCVFGFCSILAIVFDDSRRPKQPHMIWNVGVSASGGKGQHKVDRFKHRIFRKDILIKVATKQSFVANDLQADKTKAGIYDDHIADIVGSLLFILVVEANYQVVPSVKHVNVARKALVLKLRLVHRMYDYKSRCRRALTPLR